MTSWTPSARSALERYLDGARQRLGDSGADADEVVDDLRRHVEQEVVARRLEVVTEEDLRSILARVGTPEPTEDRKPEPASTVAHAALYAVEDGLRKWHPLLFCFGFLLPAITLGFELVVHGCGGLFFDPIPTLWHVLLVAVVPLGSLAMWQGLRQQRRPWRAWLLALDGAVITIAGFYTLLFAPITPFAIIGVLYLGLGLLPLAPLLSLAAACQALVRLRRWPGPSGQTSWQPWCAGAGAGVLALLVLFLPAPATRSWARTALANSGEASRRALGWLRSFGSEETLLRDCYGSRRRGELGFWPDLQGTPLHPEEARQVYFRVTGRPFNEVPPPQRRYGRGGWDFLQDMEWDQDHGGTAVAGRVKGLVLAQSRLDALADGDAAWMYVEWTMEFRNGSRLDREARAQIALPPGGMVSRLTLWVNGEEREAAFAGAAQTREAYRQVAVVQRRDPVLVSSAGPGRVLMQCFPVPRDGGTMKVRLGITAPLRISDVAQAALRWPTFVERNFSLPEGLAHSVWVEARQPLQSPAPALKPDQPKPGVYGLHGDLTDTDLGALTSIVRAQRTNQAGLFWVNEPGGSGGIISQALQNRPPACPNRLAVVLDGSAGMAASMAILAERLPRFPEATKVGVWLAGDQVQELAVDLPSAPAEARRVLAAKIRRLPAAGGQDNVPALLAAWDWLGGQPGGTLLWIHGPQPVLLDSTERLQQRLDWQTGRQTTLLDLQTSAGPNRVAEKFDAFPSYTLVPHWGTFADDLDDLIRRWRGDGPVWEMVRARVETLPVAARGVEGSKHLARLWAFDEIKRLAASGHRDQAIKLASTAQLVTPVSGAVVLENQRQFDQAGLKPVNPDSVPTVPEPGVWVLVGLGALLLGGDQLRRKRSAACTKAEVVG